MKKKKGFFEQLIEDLVYKSAIEAARDPNTGKVDPYAAAGIAFGCGKMKNFNDQMRLAAHLDVEDAFDDHTDSREWRTSCDDSLSFGISPENYEAEEEYEPGLEETGHSWRNDTEDGSEYGLDPENYESEDEYLDALEQARYSWRNDTEDGSEYGLDPEDYESEDEYLDALEQARYSWRNDTEDGSEYGLNPEDYESEDEYLDALEDARYDRRDDPEDGSEDEDVPDGVEDAHSPVTGWGQMSPLERRRLEASLCEMDYQDYMETVRHYRRFGFDPDDFEQPADYFQVVAASIRDAKKLKELATNANSSSIRSAADTLYRIKYDFGISYSSAKDKAADIRHYERILREHYTCEVPDIPRKNPVN